MKQQNCNVLMIGQAEGLNQNVCNSPHWSSSKHLDVVFQKETKHLKSNKCTCFLCSHNAFQTPCIALIFTPKINWFCVFVLLCVKFSKPVSLDCSSFEDKRQKTSSGSQRLLFSGLYGVSKTYFCTWWMWFESNHLAPLAHHEGRGPNPYPREIIRAFDLPIRPSVAILVWPLLSERSERPRSIRNGGNSTNPVLFCSILKQFQLDVRTSGTLPMFPSMDLFVVGTQ